MRLRSLSTAFLLAVALGAMARAECPSVSDADRAKLIQYVAKRYRTPASSQLIITEMSLLDSTCYRRVRFESGDFRLELFAGPDLRFLTRELLDPTLDPAVEERRKAEDVMRAFEASHPPVRGKTGAPLTIAAFSDFECPFCAKFDSILQSVGAQKDEIRVEFHHFPLSMHPWARAAAEAAACGRRQGDSYFWSFHDYLFEHQADLSLAKLRPKLLDFAEGLPEFDIKQFAACMEQRTTAVEIDHDIALAKQYGVNATPTTYVNGRRIQIVAPEQVRTLVRQAVQSAATPMAH
jgi:protein-disulfide isomerase